MPQQQTGVARLSDIQPLTTGAPSTGIARLSQIQPVPKLSLPTEDADDDTWLEWIGSTARDLAMGVGKGLISQGVRGLSLAQYIPGIMSYPGAEDFFSKSVPSALKALEPKEGSDTAPSAEQVGKLVGDVASAYFPAKWTTALATKAGSVSPLPTLTRAAIEGAGAAGVSALQGGDPAVAGTLGAAIPVAGGAAARMVPGLREAAEKGVTQFMGPTKNRFVDIVERQTPEILKRGLHGTRQEIKAQADEVIGRLRNEISAVKQTHANQMIPTNSLVSFLEDAKVPFRELVPDGKGDFVEVPLSDAGKRAIKQLGSLQQVVTDLGPEITFKQLIKLRNAWDHIVDQAGGFTERSGRGVAQSLDQASEAWAAKEGGKAIRELLDQKAPDLTALNKEFAFWKDISDVLKGTIRAEKKRTATSAPEVAEITGRLVGTGATLAGTGNVIGSLTGGFALGKVAKVATQAFLEPKWKLVGANLRTKLANAIMANKPGDIMNVLSRILAVQSGKLGQDDEQ